MKFEFAIAMPYTSDAVDHLLNDQNWPEDVRPTVIATHNVLSSLLDLEVSRLNEFLYKYVRDRESDISREMSELKDTNAALSARVSSMSDMLGRAPRVRVHFQFKPDVKRDAIAIIRTIRKHFGFGLADAKAAFDDRNCETYAFLVTDVFKKELEDRDCGAVQRFELHESLPDSH